MARKEMELFDTGVLGAEIPVSAAVKAGDFVFVGGSIGNVFGKLELVEGGIAAETQQALRHMRDALEAAGSSIERWSWFLDHVGGKIEWIAGFFMPPVSRLSNSSHRPRSGSIRCGSNEAGHRCSN